MEYLQYLGMELVKELDNKGFKPYYKWNTFNTSIEIGRFLIDNPCFKPYYKWNTFNT